MMNWFHVLECTLIAGQSIGKNFLDAFSLQK